MIKDATKVDILTLLLIQFSCGLGVQLETVPLHAFNHACVVNVPCFHKSSFQDFGLPQLIQKNKETFKGAGTRPQMELLLLFRTSYKLNCFNRS